MRRIAASFMKTTSRSLKKELVGPDAMYSWLRRKKANRSRA